MNGRGSRAIGALLAALFGAAQAQDVHKCIVNGAVTYQSKPCPSDDVVLRSPPTPSDQEQRQASSELSRQRLQAETGWIMPPTVVPPPPPPPGPATTTILAKHRRKHAIVREVISEPSEALPEPLNNCEKLNQDNDEAQDRRAQLRAPSELASHDELLTKAEADVARIAQLATASNCRLKR